MDPFLPEEDQEFLDSSGLPYRLLSERMPDGNVRRAILFPGLPLTGNLMVAKDGTLVRCDACDVLVIVPDGYSTTRLDSFYTVPRLKRADGSDPQNATGDTTLFDQSWQFWSRHLDEADWRPGVDNLRTYLSYVRAELRNT